MDIPHIATLIRVLFVLVMFGLMVIAGALIARSRSVEPGRRDAPSDAQSRARHVVQRSQRYPAGLGSRIERCGSCRAPMLKGAQPDGSKPP